MPATVRLLVAGDDSLTLAKKGDVVEVVRMGMDWGSKTVAPSWIRLTITSVPGTQETAETRVSDLLSSWEKGFTIKKVVSETPGVRRFRIDVVEDLIDTMDLSTKLDLRDAILLSAEGELVSQSKTHIEFNTLADHPLQDLETIIRLFGFRRYRFPETMIDTALSTAVFGEPIEYSRSYTWATNNVIDKLRS